MNIHNSSPSVFELIACDGLKSSLREALRYLLEYLYKNESIQKLPIPKTDEAVLILDLLIEYNYLRSYNASYAEKLYNLVRLTGSTKLRIQGVLPSLVSLIFIPYAKRKIDTYFEELNYKETRTADDLQKISLYRLMCRLSSLLNLLYLVRYAAGKSAYYSLLDQLLGIRLVNQTQYSDGNEDPNATRYQVSRCIADAMGRCLTISSYVIQFLDYWNTHSNSAPMFNAAHSIPDPPRKDELAYGDDERSSNICLICLHVRQNECALSNTGYVFCYSCLQRYVTTMQRCPVTGQPTTVNNIIKLFTSTPF